MRGGAATAEFSNGLELPLILIVMEVQLVICDFAFSPAHVCIDQGCHSPAIMEGLDVGRSCRGWKDECDRTGLGR